MVYFFKETGKYGRVKIGTTENSPEERLAQLQIGNPRKLIIIRVVDGGYNLELFLHKYFDEFRLEGEWFSYSEPIKKYIENVKRFELRPGRN